MSDDLVERLWARAGSLGMGDQFQNIDGELMAKAADKIERLQAQVEDLDMVCGLREVEIERLTEELARWTGVGR